MGHSIINNAHKIAFWMLVHLLHDSEYLASLRSEIDAAFEPASPQDGGGGGVAGAPEQDPDMAVLLGLCPHLDAIWYETMRLYNATSAVRQAVAPCVVGGKTISVGDQIMAPFRQFHTSAEIFGADARSFRPERFLENKSLSRRKGYSPFGGGYTYCPGRLFAQREIYLFVAVALRRFDFELVPQPGGPRMPQVDRDTPSPAAISPDEDVVVRLSPRVLKCKAETWLSVLARADR